MKRKNRAVIKGDTGFVVLYLLSYQQNFFDVDPVRSLVNIDPMEQISVFKEVTMEDSILKVRFTKKYGRYLASCRGMEM